jgi:hypothetical protein
MPQRSASRLPSADSKTFMDRDDFPSALHPTEFR